ncbi:carboxymuconolactone decarboxylase family protein [Roseobacter sinensis]|uniref:Carboxymuconolactone decarboxylase family protein n=1 Tax=Roseobacter sinensis TaxID=2931391 RepID=A0ABT3BBP5_9RHOB|nr:carboxymuconolactone decarboxylase family protein [Roseobacter sp. WL0113]MCV3271005.1 carboxymuconolactone decarboxylase family protein [Roseobacter sp. WL0113]
MTQRLDYMTAAPDAVKAVYGLEHYIASQSGLEPRLIHLLKLRASLINGCAYCVDMHTREARKDGLSEQWIALAGVWHEAAVYTPRERALLAWTDALTNIAQSGAPDAAYEAMCDHFTETEITNLSVAISTINVWNRLAVGFRMQHAVDRAA